MARFVPIIYSLEELTNSTICVEKESIVSIKRKFLLKQIIFSVDEGKRGYLNSLFNMKERRM
jgi:hypothetical protein